jgi:hypothetical protein
LGPISVLYGSVTELGCEQSMQAMIYVKEILKMLNIKMKEKK